VTYTRSLDYLYSLQRFGIKLGLSKIRALLEYAGNPENRFHSIHIAGTNGKGSTAAMIASIFQEAGYKVGLYTSPHLIDFTERIRINGHPIDPKTVAEYTEVLKPQIRKLKCTFFEATTAVAFMHFAHERVDIAVIETGLGGRLDATNVLNPLLTIITSIGLEHTEHLGRTIVRIAREKAGIIKHRVPCVIGNLPINAANVILRVAASKQAPVTCAPLVAEAHITSNTLKMLSLDLTTKWRAYQGLTVGFSGSFQAENARLAVTACEVLCHTARKAVMIDADHIYRGLRNARRNTGMRGRLEVVKMRPSVIIDVAHNPDAIACLVKALDDLGLRNPIIIFGVMKDKNYEQMLANLRAISDRIVAVAARIDRSLPVRILASHARRTGFKVTAGGTVRRGLQLALKNTKASETVLITGSHYVVGESLEYLEKGG